MSCGGWIQPPGRVADGCFPPPAPRAIRAPLARFTPFTDHHASEVRIARLTPRHYVFSPVGRLAHDRYARIRRFALSIGGNSSRPRFLLMRPKSARTAKGLMPLALTRFKPSKTPIRPHGADVALPHLEPFPSPCANGRIGGRWLPRGMLSTPILLTTC